MKMRFDALALAAALMAASSLGWAQGAAVTAATPPAAAVESAKPAEALVAEPYTYSQEGRRDPFVSLVSRGTDSSSARSTTAGLGGIATAELVLRGVMLSRGAYVAFISGPDGKTHRAHVNDRVADGVIRTVTPSGIVIMQEVNDPLSLVKQREVRKGLRTAEDGK